MTTSRNCCKLVLGCYTERLPWAKRRYTQDQSRSSGLERHRNKASSANSHAWPMTMVQAFNCLCLENGFALIAYGDLR